MSYILKTKEANTFGKSKYISASGKTECVEFVRQSTNAPQTPLWKQGKKVSETKSGEIPRGTAIATFDANGKYPTDSLGKHAAIYLEHNDQRILVLDQWAAQGEVKQRPIWFNGPKSNSRSNNANTFYVIE